MRSEVRGKRAMPDDDDYGACGDADGHVAGDGDYDDAGDDVGRSL